MRSREDAGNSAHTGGSTMTEDELTPRWFAAQRAAGNAWRRPAAAEDNERLRARYPRARLPHSREEYLALVASLNRDGVDWVWRHIPRHGPKGWLVTDRDEFGYKCREDPEIGRGLVVHVDGRWYDDPRGGGPERWIHLAVAGAQVPSHQDLVRVKRAFLGPDLYAYEVFPPDALYINIAPTQLHLWAPVERPALPEFSHGYELL